MIAAIDPSYSSCGVAVLDDNYNYLDSTAIHVKGKCYTGNDTLNQACLEISTKVIKFLKQYQATLVVVEIPAPSKSGFYLMALHGWLLSSLAHNGFRVVTVPCTACDSLIKNKYHSKSYIVNYCKSNKWVPDIRINNDICTAVVLAHVWLEYKKGNYKNKVFKVFGRSLISSLTE